MTIPTDIQQAIQAYYAERATPDQIAALEEWFREDEAHIKVFAEHGIIEWQVRCEHEKLDAAAVLSILREAEENAEPKLVLLKANDSNASAPRIDEQPLTAREIISLCGYILAQALRSRPAVVGSIAAALLLAAAVSVSLYVVGSDDQPGIAHDATAKSTESTLPTNDTNTLSIVATLTAEHDAVWDRRPGQDLYAGQRLTLTAGFAEITTNDGAIAIIEAPTTVELLDNDNALHLHTGKLVGICETDSSKGFVVRTAALDITDLGTRFGVEAAGLETSVHVIAGEVHVAPPDAASETESLRLTANQSARTSADNPTLARIEYDTEAFAVLRTRTVTLPGTGLGLAVGQADPAWVVVAKDGVPLTEPVAITVSEAEGHVRHLRNNPQRSQWLAWTPRAQPQEKEPRYRIRTTIDMPDHIDPATAYLTIQFAADNHLVGIMVNESPVEFQTAEPTPQWHKLEPIEVRADLIAGTNTIEFEIVNFQPREGRTGNEAGLRVEWQLHGTPSLFNQAINR